MIFNTFLMILYIYLAPGQGQTTPWGQTFDVNRKPLSLCPFVAGFKKNCFEVQFYIHIFHVSPYVYSPRQGQTIQWGQNFDDNRKAFSLCPYVASFKMISSNLILYTRVQARGRLRRNTRPGGVNFALEFSRGFFQMSLVFVTLGVAKIVDISIAVDIRRLKTAQKPSYMWADMSFSVFSIISVFIKDH